MCYLKNNDVSFIYETNISESLREGECFAPHLTFSKGFFLKVSATSLDNAWESPLKRGEGEARTREVEVEVEVDVEVEVEVPLWVAPLAWRLSWQLLLMLYESFWWKPG